MRAQLSPDSALLRHALRFGVALAAGLAIAALFDIRRGYWIDITIAVILRPERGGFAAAIAATLGSERACLDAVLAGDDASRARERAAAAADDLQGRYRRLAGEPRRGRHSLGAVWEAVAGCRRLYVATVALEAQLGRGGPRCPYNRRVEELDASPEFTATGAALRSRALVLAELDACGTALRRLESAASAIA